MIVPFIGADVRLTKFCRAGEGPLTTKYAQADNAVEETARLDRVEAPVEQHAMQAQSGLLMCLTAASFAASALISLTLLWFAVRGVQWLLFG